MTKRLISLAAIGAIGVLGLTACASGGSGGGGGDTPAAEGSGDITIGVFNGWPEGEAVSYLWKNILEDKGYNVDLQYADAGPVFAGVSTSDYDVNFDTWLPGTHAEYMEEFGDKLVDLGSWNDDAKLTIAVNDDSPITSLDEFAANADAFDNRLVGIEQGSGLNKATTEQVIPQYGMDKVDYITSSTPAMLAELSSAIAAGDNVAVTLWRPHWAYDEYAIRDLEDPKGALGDAEGIHTVTNLEFPDSFPEVKGWLENFRMDSDLLFSLENVMFNTGEEINDYSPIVKDWMAENQDWVDSLTK
nr:glycine betaine ABC transporter substrate-binding protein [Homoserinimonas sp. OAct 916]